MAGKPFSTRLDSGTSGTMPPLDFSMSSKYRLAMRTSSARGRCSEVDRGAVVGSEIFAESRGEDRDGGGRLIRILLVP